MQTLTHPLHADMSVDAPETGTVARDVNRAGSFLWSLGPEHLDDGIEAVLQSFAYRYDVSSRRDFLRQLLDWLQQRNLTVASRALTLSVTRNGRELLREHA